jgi:hypothetical protein
MWSCSARRRLLDPGAQLPAQRSFPLETRGGIAHPEGNFTAARRAGHGRTVINLVDYYKISRDRLDIPALYTGPVTKLLGGADISWLVGIVVTPAIYYPWAKATSRAPAESIYPAAPAEDRIPLAAVGKAQKPGALSLLVPKTAV